MSAPARPSPIWSDSNQGRGLLKTLSKKGNGRISYYRDTNEKQGLFGKPVNAAQ